MKTVKKLCAGLIFLVIASGCTSVKRFKSASYQGEDNSLVDMELFGASLDRPGQVEEGKSLWDLSASAQTQMIQILNERYPDNGQFTMALNHEYLLKGAAPVTDYTSANLRMVFTISKQNDYEDIGKGEGCYSPADRIESLKFSLGIPPEANLHFTDWNRYETEYGEIEIAGMSFSRSLELESEVSGEVASGVLKGSVNRSEDQVLKSRYLILNGSLSDHRLEIEEQGTREIDLAGNVVADVSMEFDRFPERITIPLYTTDAEGGVQKVSALKFVDVMVPRMEGAPETVMGLLEMEYLYRHVESGWKTFQEWDDKVAYYKGKVSKEIVLFERHEYTPLLYTIGSDVERKSAVRVRTGGGTEYPLQFMGYAEAVRFLEWLLHPASSVKIGDNELIYGDEKSLKVMPVY
ncbi:MAG: hypothetical protein ABFS10_08350 [Bacteroidota bacterium]